MPSPPPPRNPIPQRGTARAIFAVTGVVDDVQDLILPGAFTRTLRSRKVKSVWHHEWKDPIGRVLDIEEWMPGDPRFATIPGGAVWPREAGALVAVVQFNLRTGRGRDAYEQVKQWHDANEAQFSIGYKVPPGAASKRHDGVRIIHDLDLYEVSPVLHGAHPLTRSIEVKSDAVSRVGGLEHKATWSSVELEQKTAESQTGRGAMVALYPPRDIAEQIAQPDGTPAEDLHITLAYLGDAADLGAPADDLHDLVAEALRAATPLKGTIGGIGTFPDSGDGIPTWVPVDVPGLAELRQAVTAALATSPYGHTVRTNHGFTPHITLGYDLPPTGPVPSTPVTFDQVHIVLGPDRTPVALTGPAPDVSTPVPAVETKTARSAVLEAKAAGGRAPAEHKSARAAVLEAKSAPPALETTVTAPMPYSYEQLRSRLGDAARTLLSDSNDCFVMIEATYPDRVIVSHHQDDETRTYAIPYTALGRDIDLGTPQRVELATVALPADGAQRAVDGDEEAEARYLQPAAGAIEDATASLHLADAAPGSVERLRPVVRGLLHAMAQKGAPVVPDHAPLPKTDGFGLDLWDSQYDITDGWDDEDDEDEPAEQTDAPAAASTPEEDDEDQVRLDPAEVKAALASLSC
ncbi:2'-5' RNA ligase family protein [Streptomyces sp. NPDC088915]|uniref:2'-5' RNA ligase family protein n=1 Tax=Streptomyces sp. NPDC088915 TaxID=3365912 RepID=UPI0037FA3FCB